MTDAVDYYSLEGGRKSINEEADFRKEIRRGFARKVFGIVCLQLLLSAFVSSLFLFIPGGVTWAKLHGQPLVIIASVCMIVSSLVLLCSRQRFVYPYNYILLFVFTICEALIIGITTAFYSVSSVLLVVAAASLICLCLFIFSYQTKYDLTSLMGFMFILTINLFIFSLFISILGSFMTSLYLSLCLILFSVYLIIDIQLIIKRGSVYLDEDDYIIAAIIIYIDIINIFLTLLRLFGDRSN